MLDSPLPSPQAAALPADEYRLVLQTLSEGSVRVHFDPYEDIDWTLPLDPGDPRWVLPARLDPLGATAWYQALPPERQVEIGRWRMMNTVRVGAAFESLLVRGLMHYAINRPNRSAEFRYCLHEMTEECNHIQMFQELVNHSGTDAPGPRRLFRLLTPPLAFIGGYVPLLFMIGILGGEEPIDHYQKALMRVRHPLPDLVQRVMEIHVAEEARHISFAGEFLRVHHRRQGRAQNATAALAFPFIMRWLAGEILTPPRSFKRKFDIPDDVWHEAFWRGEQSRDILASYFTDMRALTTELGWLNRFTVPIWRRLGIYGPSSLYRGEPDRSAIIIPAPRH